MDMDLEITAVSYWCCFPFVVIIIIIIIIIYH